MTLAVALGPGGGMAYAGASIDPTAALAAQRFARIRDEQLRSHR